MCKERRIPGVRGRSKRTFDGRYVLWMGTGVVVWEAWSAHEHQHNREVRQLTYATTHHAFTRLPPGYSWSTGTLRSSEELFVLLPEEGPQAETADGAELDSHAARSCSRRSCSSREASAIDGMEKVMKESISMVWLVYELTELGYALGVQADRWTRMQTCVSAMKCSLGLEGSGVVELKNA